MDREAIADFGEASCPRLQAPAFALRTVCTRCGAIAQRYEKPRSSFNDRPMGIKNSLRYYAERSCVTLKHSIIIKCQWRE